MKIKMLAHLAGAVSYEAGCVYDVEQREASRLISAGFAIPDTGIKLYETAQPNTTDVERRDGGDLGEWAEPVRKGRGRAKGDAV